uniref:Uncharacterized protein n=1 Tax=Sphenodon punctatus TaxID=8508 RepID=A0A8D0GTE2_SPHPU
RLPPQAHLHLQCVYQYICLPRLYSKLCTGKIGIAVKVIGGNLLFWTVFVIGYVTGYYVHKCK